MKSVFEDKHRQFIAGHMKNRKGESLCKLKAGHGYGEKLFLQNVWWPTIGHYDYLFPEYELSDFKDGSRYLDFAKDHLEDKPRLCQQIIQQMMGRWFAEVQSQSTLSAGERDILRIASRLGTPITAKDIRNQLPFGENYTRKLLHQLAKAGILASVGGGTKRIHSYKIITKDLDTYL